MDIEFEKDEIDILNKALELSVINYPTNPKDSIISAINSLNINSYINDKLRLYDITLDEYATEMGKYVTMWNKLMGKF